MFLRNNLGGYESIGGRDCGVIENDMLGGQCWQHGAQDRVQGFAIRNENLYVPRGLGDFRGRAQEVRLWTHGAIPNPDLMAGPPQAGSDSAPNDAEPDDAYCGFSRYLLHAGSKWPRVGRSRFWRIP